MSKLNQFLLAIFRSPLLWGSLASVGFFALLNLSLPGSAFFQRYCAGHPVEYVETIMFFVGMAALGIKALDLAVQQQSLARPLLGPPQAGGQPISDCPRLAAHLARLPERRQDEYYARRLRNGLNFVQRRNTAEGLDDELRYLGDLDAEDAHGGYGLVRMVIWAIPILGFLGTVIGITEAIASLSPQALETSLPAVVAGLGVAFDTTALALALSIMLFFTQFYVDRLEGKLLARVADQVAEELLGRFQVIPAGPDGQLVALRRLGETLLGTTEQLVQRQAELWRASVEAMQERSTRVLDVAGQQLQKTLSVSLAEGLKAHAGALSLAQQTAEEKNRHHWSQLQQTMTQSVASLASMQNSLVEKADVLARAVDATGQVAKLEENLNRNLNALAGSKNFEQTVVSLAAAIHLLTARLNDLPTSTPPVQLSKRTSQAA